MITMGMIGRYDDELQPLMDNIFILSAMQGNQNEIAHDLLWKYHFQCTGKYLRSVLGRMLELDMIEPLDIDSFIEIFTGFVFTTIYRNQLSNALGDDGWARCLDMVFSIVEER